MGMKNTRNLKSPPDQTSPWTWIRSALLPLALILLSASTAQADQAGCTDKGDIIAGNAATAAPVKGCLDDLQSAVNGNLDNANLKSNAAIEATKISGTAMTLSGAQTVTGNKTFTGTLDLTSSALQGASPLVFEGASDDAFETTIAVGDPTADRTVTLGDEDHNLPEQVVKGWCNFDGTQPSPSCDDSFNVTSITDNGTGDYTINWDTDFSTSNYAVICTAVDSSGSLLNCTVHTFTAGTTRLQIHNSENTFTDSRCSVIAIGNH